jgi:Domain of unknown function (DUF4439)
VSAAIDAAQQALAGEHAAMWAYAFITPRAGRRAPLGVPSLVEHRRRRDALVDWLRAHQAEPVIAKPGYALPFQVSSASTAAALARRVEDGCARQWVQVIQAAVGQPALLSIAQHSLTDSAGRRVRWGGVPDALPGISP